MASGDKIYIGIKSIQRGVISIPSGSQEGTVTIKPVDPNKTIVNNTGMTTDYNYGTAIWNAAIILENETTLKMFRDASLYVEAAIAYEVIEFY